MAGSEQAAKTVCLVMDEDDEVAEAYTFFDKRSAEELLCILKAAHLPHEEVHLCSKTSHLISYCAKRFEFIAKSPTFVHVHFDSLYSLLSSPDLEVSDESVVVHQIARWVRYDTHSRKCHIDKLLELHSHDDSHPFKYRAGIVANWDVFHHSRHHGHGHNRIMDSASGHHHDHHHHHRFRIHLPHRHHRSHSRSEAHS